MKIVPPDAISQVDPNNECFILKGVFKPEECAEVSRWLADFLAKTEDNEKFRGQNWHYHALKDGIDFHSFIFKDLKKLGNEKLLHFYRTLFDLYQQLGECEDLDFESEISSPRRDGKTIHAHALWYPAGTGKFKWHQHPGDYQRFTLLCNLTKPRVDYTGGETLVDMGGFTEEFAEDFGQGDVFSFPYTKRHMVNQVRPGDGGLDRRIIVLMPLHPLSPPDEWKEISY